MNTDAIERRPTQADPKTKEQIQKTNRDWWEREKLGLNRPYRNEQGNLLDEKGKPIPNIFIGGCR